MLDFICCLRGARAWSSASHEMQNEQDQAHDEDDVNETGGYVECEEAEHPENDQNCGDDPKHVQPPCS